MARETIKLNAIVMNELSSDDADALREFEALLDKYADVHHLMPALLREVVSHPEYQRVEVEGNERRRWWNCALRSYWQPGGDEDGPYLENELVSHEGALWVSTEMFERNSEEPPSDINPAWIRFYDTLATAAQRDRERESEDERFCNLLGPVSDDEIDEYENKQLGL